MMTDKMPVWYDDEYWYQEAEYLIILMVVMYVGKKVFDFFFPLQVSNERRTERPLVKHKDKEHKDKERKDKERKEKERKEKERKEKERKRKVKQAKKDEAKLAALLAELSEGETSSDTSDDTSDDEIPKPKNIEKYLCRFVEQGKPCKYTNCRFAHTSEEVKLLDCHSGIKCNKVVKSSKGGWRNVSNCKTCPFTHPGESRSDYWNRMVPK